MRSAIPKDVIIAGIMQHIEEAGIHSGDSSCVLPAVSIREETLETLRTYTRKLALALKVVGLVNLQFAIQRDAQGQDHVYVIEVNPRASRTVPYVSKATGIPLAKIAARLMTGRKLRELLPAQLATGKDLETGTHYYVKSPVFPWNKFAGVDTVLGPEMKSTGEVMGVAATFGEAFAKAQLSAGQVLPTGGTVFFSVNDHDKPAAVELARRYVHLGFKIVATEGTANVLESAGLTVERVFKVKEGRPNVVDLIKGDRIQLIVNTPRGQDTFFDEKAIRRAAVLARIPTITTIAAAQAAAEGIAAMQQHQHHGLCPAASACGQRLLRICIRRTGRRCSASRAPIAYPINAAAGHVPRKGPSLSISPLGRGRLKNVRTTFQLRRIGNTGWARSAYPESTG